MKKIRDTNYFITEEGFVISPYGKKISPWKENNTGYLLVRIRRNKKPLCLRLHRILAEAYLANPEGKTYVKHKNDNIEDNSLSNLEWGDRPDNTQEGYDNGCYRFYSRKHRVRAIHKETNVEIVFDSVRSLSESLNLNRKNVTAILKKRKVNNYDYEFYYEMSND